MSMTQESTSFVNGREVKVINRLDSEALTKAVSDVINDAKRNGEVITTLGMLPDTDDEGNMKAESKDAQIKNARKELAEITEKIESGRYMNGNYLAPFLERITRKKNGRFRKSSGTIIEFFGQSATYSDEFTESWYVYAIYAYAIDENTVAIDYKHTQENR